MKAAFLVPYRCDGHIRDRLWEYTRYHLIKNHGSTPIVAADNGGDLFNRGASINFAAKMAEDWDVAVVHDADNICNPEQLEVAIRYAHQSGKVVYPYETYMYLDNWSTDRLMHRDGLWLMPFRRDDTYDHTLRWHHYSGIQVIPRVAWDAIGGYVEFDGWGGEDLATQTLIKTYTAGVEWGYGCALHLWHPPVWRDLEARMRGRKNNELAKHIGRLAPGALREFMAERGHKIP